LSLRISIKNAKVVQIQLNFLLEDHHFGYIAKFTKEELNTGAQVGCRVILQTSYSNVSPMISQNAELRLGIVRWVTFFSCSEVVIERMIRMDNIEYTI
jgi:hypothetical protein